MRNYFSQIIRVVNPFLSKFCTFQSLLLLTLLRLMFHGGLDVISRTPAPFHLLPTSATAPLPGVVRAPAFAPSALLLRASLNSAKLAHSHRPRFQLVPQPETPSAPLARPLAPATMLGLATLALRVWAYAHGRPLHSGPFRLRDKKSRPPRAPFWPHCPSLSPRLAGFGFPLKDYAAKPARLGSPTGAPLMNS